MSRLKMKIKSQKSLIPFIGITLILLAVLSRRLFIRSYSMDSTLGFLAAFVIILVSFLILKIVLKNKNRKQFWIQEIKDIQLNAG